MKRSASSKDSPPERPTLFIDRNAWSNALGAALDEAGIPFEAHRRHFGEHDKTPESDDSTWLRAVANRGWVVVTRDKNIRYRINELAAMQAAKLHVFVFTQGALTGRETGQLLVDAYQAIAKAIVTHAPPAFFSVLRNGVVKLLKVRDSEDVGNCKELD